MNAKTRAAIKEAERLLNIRSYDSAHDISHHRSVLKTARAISKHVSEAHDTQLLEIACMWHDVVSKDYDDINHKIVTADTAQCLKDFMLNAKFTEAQAETVFLAVKHHEFDDTPVNTEGKILFDADKLDNLNLERVRRFVASDRIGDIPKWKLKAYIKGGVAIIKATRSRLHFSYSRQLFDQTVDKLWDDKEVAYYAAKYDVDLEDIKKALRGKPSLFDKIVGLIRK